MKSSCGIDGEECFCQSGVKCLKEVSVNICSSCSRFKDGRDILYELLGEEIGGEWVNNQTLGIIYSLLKILNDSKIEISHENKVFLKEFISSK